MLRIRRPQDFAAATLFIAIGVIGLWVGSNYQFGNSARMGPGYFPVLVSALLIGLGIIVGAQSLVLAEGPKLTGVAWRSFLLIIASILAFGFLIEHVGLVLTVMVTVAIAAFATREADWQTTTVLAAFLAAFCVIIFVIALNQPIAILPALD